MKRIIFILSFILLICALCVVSSATEITSGQDFKNALTSSTGGTYNISGDLSDNSEAITVNNATTLVFNLVGDTTLDDNLTITADANITFNLNGYNLTLNRTGSGTTNQGFLLVNSQNCRVTFNGVKAENGTITNSITAKDLLVYCQGGNVACNNVNIASGEEMFFTKVTGLSTTIQLDGGTYRVTSNDPFINCCNLGNNTFFKNCTLLANNKKITVDDNCSDDYRNSVYGGTGYDIIFENVLMEGFNISSGTSLHNFVFINIVNNLDSNPDNNFTLANVTLGDDRHRAVSVPEATIINTSTCMVQGTSQYKSYAEPTVVKTTLPLAEHVVSDTIVGIEYESYLLSGYYKHSCANAGCTAKLNGKDAQALFVFLGYSTPEDGSYGIVASFTVNQKAVSEYEALSKKALSYGIVAGAKSKLGDNNPLDASGNTVSLENGSVVKAPVKKDYVAYDFVVTDMTDAQLDIELVIATYVVVTEGENVSVVYLQETQKIDTLSAISYNLIPTE